jgi:hypothetical protein
VPRSVISTDAAGLSFGPPAAGGATSEVIMQTAEYGGLGRSRRRRTLKFKQHRQDSPESIVLTAAFGDFVMLVPLAVVLMLQRLLQEDRHTVPLAIIGRVHSLLQGVDIAGYHR